MCWLKKGKERLPSGVGQTVDRRSSGVASLLIAELGTRGDLLVWEVDLWAWEFVQPSAAAPALCLPF